MNEERNRRERRPMDQRRECGEKRSKERVDAKGIETGSGRYRMRASARIKRVINRQ